MSGTSMDGLDIALCRFELQGEQWSYAILAAETLPYTSDWLVRLQSLPELTGEELMAEHAAYGNFLGQAVCDFQKRHPHSVDFVASHGHTVFHQPDRGFTFQAGAGSAIAAVCGLPVVSDFRTADVAMGGQGAPLVPIGDRLLFSPFDACLNLGGIANISFEREGRRIAFDVSPCNLLLNDLAGRIGLPYDDGGKLASSGSINDSLLQRLNALPYYTRPFPKSLGREDIEHDFLPLLDEELMVADSLATVIRHIAVQLAAVLPAKKEAKLLISGGGALNTALIAEISANVNCEVVVGTPDLLHFKEALIFAFLGVLRWRGEVNVLSSVTGSRSDHCAGSIDLP